MAIRADFKFRNLYASVSYRSIHTATSVRDSVTVVSDRRLHVVSDFRQLISEPSYRALTGVLNWRQLFMADIEVHATPEIIIRTDYFTFADSIALNPNLGPSDSVILSESQAFSVFLVTDDDESKTPILDSPVVSFSRADTDSFIVSDSSSFLSSLGKADSLTFGDGVIAFHPSLGRSETISLGESKAISASKVSSDSVSMSESSVTAVAPIKTDSFAFTDSQASSVGQVSSDSTAMTESRVAVRNPGAWTWAFDDTITGIADPDSFTLGDTFSRVVPYVRSFTDAFSLDDFAQVDKDVNGVKTNVYSLADDLFYGLSKVDSDSILLVESAAISVSRPASDTFSFSDTTNLSPGIAKTDSTALTDDISLDPFLTGAMLNQSSVGAMFLNAD